MNYLIEHKISTLAHLTDPFEFCGFSFRQWDSKDSNQPDSYAWVARKEVAAADALAAINQFREELIPIVDKVALVSQCFTTAELEPFFVARTEHNPDHVAWIWLSRMTQTAPLPFGKEQVESLHKLDALSDSKNHAIRYFRESNNATSWYTRTAMLSSAAEGISGETEDESGKRETDRDELRRIVADDALYREFWGYGKGLRNKLLHGGDIKASDRESLNKLYRAVVNYFNKKYGTTIDSTIVNPQRHPYGNYRMLDLLVRAQRDWKDSRLEEVMATFGGLFTAKKLVPPEGFAILGRLRKGY